MAKIPLRSGFTLMPEGMTILKCVDANYDDDFGKMVLNFVDVNGNSIRENFNFKTDTGDWNNKALSAFGFFARALLNLSDEHSGEVEHTDLIGHYMEAEIVHNPGKEEGKMFANIGREKHPAKCFEGETPPAEVPASNDLDDLLG